MQPQFKTKSNLALGWLGVRQLLADALCAGCDNEGKCEIQDCHLQRDLEDWCIDDEKDEG